jgi:hypothetical protein
MKTYVQIVDDWQDKAVETIDVSDKSERMIDKLVAGIEINLNHEQYTVYIRNENELYEQDGEEK